MARKRSEGRSLPTESGSLPVTHRRPRSKPVPAAETVIEAPPVMAAAAAPTVASQPAVEEAADRGYEREEIARLAYSYWEERGGQGGSPEEDWLRAEQEYRRRRGA